MPGKKLIRLVLFGATAGFVALQFFRPARDVSPSTPVADDFTVKYAVPEPFRSQLWASCYDCHSDQTRYPWYAEVQPVAWWLQSHIDDGKRHLNLSAFGQLSDTRKADKLDEMIEELTFGTMPLKSYTLIHRQAALTPAESKALVAWLENLRDSFEDN